MLRIAFLHLPDDRRDRSSVDLGSLHQRSRPVYVVGIDGIEEVVDLLDGRQSGTLTDMQVTWTSGVDVGATTAATATIKIPTSPFPAEIFCAGKDTTVHSLPDAAGGGLQFRLSTLTSGPGCGTVHRGMLHACWSP
ncbi:MAG TPA: hypothetical protein VGK52_18595 [Polyangia bacterium]